PAPRKRAPVLARWAGLGFCGGVITLFTAVLMPLFGFVGAEIYFGILHCLGACMIIAGILMPLIKKIDYRIGASVSAVLFLMFYDIERRSLCFGMISLPDSWYQYDFLAPLGLHSSNFFSADYFSIFPWVFMFLCGAFVGKLAVDEGLPGIMYKKHSKSLSFIGKNSLWIYLAHQPVLYALLFVIAVIMH
ncbi:MAG: DUF1624 domain-containing protein, partial [Eubacterium sp.]|nr:DUF1624 domain-containing protein [Eubacterium sp.]